MKKNVKALIKRLTLLVQFKGLCKGWIAVDGDGEVFHYLSRPDFDPSGASESLDCWLSEDEVCGKISTLDNLPLSIVCPSLPPHEALFYTDGENVWLIEL